jgi:hypothetical protein
MSESIPHSFRFVAGSVGLGGWGVPHCLKAGIAEDVAVSFMTCFFDKMAWCESLSGLV